MCGRYIAATPPADLAAELGVTDVRSGDLGLRFNVAPTDPVYAVAVGSDGARRLGTFRWGLVPSWSKDAKGGAKMINARAETVTAKPAFKKALARRRCLVPADGFYEWLRVGSDRQPFHLAPKDGGIICFAGLWEVWRPDDDPEAELLRTCTIITTDANATLRPIHDRMPVILPREAWDTWLDRSVTDPDAVFPLLAPAPDDLLERTPVSKLVNNVRNDGPELLAPADDSAGAGQLQL
jgi:putative SOS response-associated peptidase YedK